MIINHNITALNTHRQLSSATGAQSKSMEKLASGMRINKAGDDAAGLAISEKMRGQIRGLDQASRNAQDGISLIATAEGALSETADILQRMRELGVQSSNDTNTTDDRKEIQKEVNQLTSEINRIGNNTEFNTQKLINGEKTDTGALTFQIGSNNGQTLSLEISDMRSKALGLSGDTGGEAKIIAGDGATDEETAAAAATADAKFTTGVTDTLTDKSGTDAEYALDMSTSTKATQAVEVIDKAIKTVSGERSKLGSYQNRLEHTINNLGTSSENLTAAESRVRDVDMAKEMMEQTKNSILSQAAQAMLAQANQQPQGVLQLLR